MNYWFIFCKSDLLLEKLPDGTYTIPYQEDAPVETKPWTHIMDVSRTEEMKGKAFTIDTPVTDNPKYEMCGLRASYYKLPIELYLLAGKCHELLYWDQNTQFCGVCGAPMKMHTDISKRCTSCGKEVWPQLATAIIVAINRPGNTADGSEDSILLVHAKNFRGDFYGLVAGFVETGESLEEAVAREVMEETHVKVKNLRYFASQPWPYPCGLMVGFHAEYDGGDIQLQRSEISSGGWFTREEVQKAALGHGDAHLPHIPEKLSIARQLLDDWLKR